MTFWSLDNARSYVMRERLNGVLCPCCGQFAKVYRRALNRQMIRSLGIINAVGGDEFVHSPTVLGGRRGEEARLEYWGLVEAPGPVDKLPQRGYWRCTSRGALFLDGAITVPSHALIYNGRCLRLTGDPVHVDQIGPFDLKSIMASVQWSNDAEAWDELGGDCA